MSKPLSPSSHVRPCTLLPVERGSSLFFISIRRFYKKNIRSALSTLSAINPCTTGLAIQGGVFALSINLECSLYKYFVKIRSMLLRSPVMYHTYIRRIRKRAIPCSSSQSDGFTKKQKVDVLSTLFRYQAV